MKPDITSIRPFIGAKNFEISRDFYKTLGFEELVISPDMSSFVLDGFSFYLQKYFIKDWVDNTMVFLEVQNLEDYRTHLTSLDLPKTFKSVRLSKIVHNHWGREFFLHDPSGVLWHIGNFNTI